MSTELHELFEHCKKDKATLVSLKAMAVKSKLMDLAVTLREIEKINFPETEEVKRAKDEANVIINALSMVGLTVNNHTAWLINETLKVYNQKGGDFSIDDATLIKSNCERIFEMTS